MTLPSLKNRQITPRSIHLANKITTNMAAFVCLSCVLLSASTGTAGDGRNAGRVRLVAAEKVSAPKLAKKNPTLKRAENPISKLKHRSASKRIQELQQKFGWGKKSLEQPVSLETPKPIVVTKGDPIRLFPASERKLLGIDNKKTIPSFDLPDWEVTDQKSKKTPQQPKKVQTKSDTNALKKIGEILPYADYAPPLDEDINQEKTYPKESWPYKDAYKPREFKESIFAWEPSNLFYNPLYFEDAQLERYGHTYPDCVQPFVSVGKFGVQLIGLPYQMSIDPVFSCQSPLGWYRPGECAPKLIYQIPWNKKAALTELGVLTGLFFIIP